MDSQLLRFANDKIFVFWDFETYNLCLNFFHNLPWQIGMVKLKGDTVLDTYGHFINWKTKIQISKMAAEKTHFKQENIDLHGLPPDEVFDVMYSWFSEADYLIGHNVLGFDIYLTKEWYRLKGKDPEALFKKVIDTNCLAKAIKLNYPAPNRGKTLLEYQYPLLHHRQKGLKTRLEILGKEYGIEHDYETLHEAISDVSLDIKVWNKQKVQIDI